MGKTALCILIAYLSGSVLYANIFGDLFGVRERYAESADKNPGVSNAYTYGGFWCGTLTLIFEVAKGALPVLFLRNVPGFLSWGFPLLVAAPVVGHILPVFYGFRGGKGIAVTFGSLAGLLPYFRPLLLLAAAFIFFSVCVRIFPHYYRTVASYLTAAAMMLTTHISSGVCVSFLLITGLVCLRLYLGHEEKERFEVKLLWKR